jgi:hypothetical protein
MLFALNTSASKLYVDLNSANPTAPYAGWDTAATNIQDAVDASTNGDSIIVTNGLYQSGGRVVFGSITNRLAVTAPVIVESVNGPAFTIIQGFQDTTTPDGMNAVRCVYLTGGALLTGFTLTNGGTLFDLYENLDDRLYSGGAVYCGSSVDSVSNCVITGCSASDTGGGVVGGTLINCLITNCSSYLGGGAGNNSLDRCLLDGNSAGYGGGAYQCNLTNCLVIGNSSDYAGGGAVWSSLRGCTLVSNLDGAAGCSMTNCIIYYNNYDNFSGDTMDSCCTTPDPGGGNNITNDPAFVDPANGNFRLQPFSPCINSGNNSAVSAATDLDGNPRVAGGSVDIGAYEYQTPASIISYAWLQKFGLPVDGSADFADTDSDGMNNWQEWVAGTDPSDPSSVLKMLAPLTATNSAGVIVSWQSVSNRTYYLQRSTNPAAQPAFVTIQSNLFGQSCATSFTDTNAPQTGALFYRVGVQ